VVFYVVYFSIIYGENALYFIQGVASVQNALWFVPFVWLGIMLYSLASGLVLQGIALLGLSLLFITGLFVLGTKLNERFGLYEPPAITISQGVYAPKKGMLGKLGFSSVEAALIRKDLKAFTRRRELISAFIVPIVFLLIPVMSSLNASGSSGAFPPQFGFAFTSLFPVGLMAYSLGNFMTGEEGQNIWRIYMSPVSAKAFIRSKYAFMLFLLVDYFAYNWVGWVLHLSSFGYNYGYVGLRIGFVAVAVAVLSHGNGIKGADLTRFPDPE
jgi:hypothetical protein